MSKIKITIIGAGYVGMSLAVLLSKKNEVKLLDIDEEKVSSINANQSPIFEADIIEALKTKDLNLSAFTDPEEAIRNSDFIFIATPTNFNESNNSFDTSIVEISIKNALKFSKPKSLIIIKSTVPIGFTETQSFNFKSDRIVFSPEFLREGKALIDNLYPSRFIIGGPENELTKSIAKIILDAVEDKDINCLYMSSKEAEAVKLFSNAFLAMRVAFFNELDTFAMEKNLSSLKIINGVSLDSRIGDFYNNPSFGYGGYCLPKDSKQLLTHYDGMSQSLIKSIIESNSLRKDYITNKIKAINPKKIGIYRLIMKDGSENFRESAVLTLIERLHSGNSNMIIYEPKIADKFFMKIPIENDLNKFIQNTDLIIANRLNNDLKGCADKVFSRDLFQKDT